MASNRLASGRSSRGSTEPQAMKISRLPSVVLAKARTHTTRIRCDTRSRPQPDQCLHPWGRRGKSDGLFVQADHMHPRSRGALSPEACRKSLALEHKGRGECRVPNAPASLVRAGSCKYAPEYSQRKAPETSGIP